MGRCRGLFFKNSVKIERFSEGFKNDFYGKGGEVSPATGPALQKDKPRRKSHGPTSHSPAPHRTPQPCPELAKYSPALGGFNINEPVKELGLGAGLMGSQQASAGPLIASCATAGPAPRSQAPGRARGPGSARLHKPSHSSVVSHEDAEQRAILTREALTLHGSALRKRDSAGTFYPEGGPQGSEEGQSVCCLRTPWASSGPADGFLLLLPPFPLPPGQDAPSQPLGLAHQLGSHLPLGLWASRVLAWPGLAPPGLHEAVARPHGSSSVRTGMCETRF